MPDTPHRRPSKRAQCLALGAILTLTACSGETDARANDNTPDNTTGKSSKVEIDTEELFGQHESKYETLFDLALAEQEYIRDCMAEQGFEYIPRPIDPALTNSSLTGNVEFKLIDYDFQLEQAQLYGYGDLHSMINMVEVGTSQKVDPNKEIMAALPQEELEKRAKALAGSDVDPGCIGRAVDFTRGDMPRPEETEAIAEIERQVFEAMAADPMIIEAKSNWQTCIAEHGYDLDEPGSGGSLIQKRLNEIVGSEITSDTPESELRKAIDAPENQAALRELLEEDRNLATLDVTCSRSFVELENQLYLEYFTEFSS